MNEITDSFVRRDILESGVINETAFYNLFRILSAQTGNLININELSSTLRIKNATVDNYLKILQKSFYITLTRPFYRNLRKELIRMPKVFYSDTGLRNCLLNNFQPLSERTDKGELWENTVFRTLADRYGLYAILYWRTSGGNEMDFVNSDSGKLSAVEAKFDFPQIKKSKYKLFRETYPEIPIQFIWFHPFGHDFFRRIF